MSLSRISKIAVGGLAMGHPGFAADATASEIRSDPQSQPNILFIIIDDHGPGLHDVLGGDRVQTPNMRRLAERGTWFKNAYVAAPACGPSRAAFLTGVRPSRSGSYYNTQAYRRDPDAWIR
jgi:arylsulfatase A-like enzyme